jgi:ribonuclease Y
MTHIEEVAKSFSGVEDAAAYQAGREVRVIVKPDEVSDEQLTVLTKKIAERLEEDAKWAGQIKVVAIRETRATEIAK